MQRGPKAEGSSSDKQLDRERSERRSGTWPEDPGGTSMRARSLRVALVLASAIIVAPVAADGAPPADAAASTRVIVRAAEGQVDDVSAAVVRLGGTVHDRLPIIAALAAELPADRVDELAASPDVLSVTPDAPIAPQAVDPNLGYDAAETSSLSAISQIIGAQDLWNAGYAGQGIDVAVIDTGVSRVPGLNAAGKVIDGPDLSFDSQEPTLRNLDAFGHGTHMASIIAGSDVAPGTSGKRCSTCLGPSPYTNTTKFVGIAPEARIINVKVGAFDGATDTSQVIAAIDWVVQHRKDPGFNIRVLNLSFGTDSTQPAASDPLALAADVAWRAGIIVVAAAGNDGMFTPTLANPAYTPSILAVGTSDPRGTIATNDDSVPMFAQHGTADRGVDLVAPGVSVLGLRVPGSFVDTNVSTGKVGTRFQRSSGTSQSAAVVSGLAALVLSKFPTASPDSVKAFLKYTATPMGYQSADSSTSFAKLTTGLNTWYWGAGTASGRGAASLPTVPVVPAAPTTMTGSGTLEGSRGSFHVGSAGKLLTGEVDIFGKKWNASAMASSTVAQKTWVGGMWNGARWTGDVWEGARWSSALWTSTDWAGARWSGARWSGVTWDGVSWRGTTWSGARWSSGTWEGARWSGARWSDSGWS